jgi:hypothetical protein
VVGDADIVIVAVKPTDVASVLEVAGPTPPEGARQPEAPVQRTGIIR